MLNWSYILQKIKDDLGYPHEPIERSDDEIIDYLKRNALRRFEFYFPDKNRITLSPVDPNVKVPGQLSTFYIFDPDDREIKNIKSIYTSAGDLMMFGHDINGAWSFGEIPEICLQNNIARSTKIFSPYNYTFEFLPPNMMKITPQYMNGEFVVEYERSHDPELSTIPPDLAIIFTDLCDAMINMWLGKNRMKYSEYTTPFGNVQVNGSDMYNEGKELYDKVIEKMENSIYCMNTVFEVG